MIKGAQVPVLYMEKETRGSPWLLHSMVQTVYFFAAS